ncbi:hypothetical protein [Gimesia chilikensis]|uniref:hypothetical protein n=1 Tax=Gimesia chilikensis TaxID=2605989 RepID=UPI003A93AD9B
MTAPKPRPANSLSMRILVWGTPVFFSLLILVQTGAFRTVKSPTFDETFYLSAALQTVHQGQLDQRLPRKGVAPLPILLNYYPAVRATGGVPRAYIWKGELTDPPLINRARLMNALLVGISSMLLVYVWLYRRRGYLAGLLGAALLVFSPVMLAHLSLATTDSCFTLMGLLALAALTGYWKRPLIRTLFWVALTVALAISAKYSGIFLLPCVLVVVVLAAAQQQLTELSLSQLWKLCQRVIIVFTLFLLLMMPLTWAFHLFAFAGPLKAVPYARTQDDSPWIRILGRGPTAQKIMELAHKELKSPAPLWGILHQIEHNSEGHPAYLHGEVSEDGWWYYFLLVWLWKSTPVELVFTVLTLILIPFLWQPVRKNLLPALTPDQTETPSTEDETSETGPTPHAPCVWLLAGAVLLTLALMSRLNLGQRYLLIFYPLLILFTVDQIWPWLQKKKAVLYLFCGGCILFQILALQTVKPHYLSYFNRLAGGPESGYQYLLDSNLDWGQDLPAARAALEELPPADRERCLICYFGTALPESYGIKAFNMRERMPTNPEHWKYLVISANYLQGLYSGKDPYQDFRSLTPLKRVGYSMFLFDLQSPEARQALETVIQVSIEMRKEYEQRVKAQSQAEEAEPGLR